MEGAYELLGWQVLPRDCCELDRHIKSIDNALQRVKRKLEKYIISRGDITDLRTVYSGLLAIDPSERFHNKK